MRGLCIVCGCPISINVGDKRLCSKCLQESKIQPPLGLIPKWVRQRQRYFEICEAISRYYNAGLEIPIKWVEEHNEIIKSLKSEDKFKL